MLWGATALPGTATVETVAAYGEALRYMRDFGDDGGDSDALPELPPHGRGKWLAKPPGCLLHCGWKDDVELLVPWLDLLTQDIWLTWWHENHGDAGQSPALYRSTATRMVEIIRAHPNGHHVVRNGPAVTRYWLAQKRGNPLDYWYDGANTYFIDVYADGPDDRAGYRPGTQIIGEALAPIRAALPGVEIALSEYGLRLIGDDTGPGRAAAMREHATYLNAQPDVIGATWWDIGGCRITGRPEEAVWRQILEEATPVAWYLNPALTTMRNEVNARYPSRDQGSDGTIGDEAHQNTSSDHNPDGDGSVDAWDMDVEVNGAGRPYAADVEFLKARFEAHPASRYWIHNDQIASRSDGWTRRSYAYAGEGRNRHTQHVHWNTREEYEDSTAPWGIQEEDDMTPEQAALLDKIGRRTLAILNNNAEAAHLDGTKEPNRLRSTLIALGAGVAGVDEQVIAGLEPRFAEVLAAIAADDGNTIELTPEQVEELAALLAAQLPAPPSADEVADAVVAEIAS